MSVVGDTAAADSVPFELPEIAGEFRPWKYLVIHHSASESGSVESIDAAHRQRRDAQGIPWQGIGYHFVIGNGRGLPDGALAATFRWREQRDGAHAGVAAYNTHGLGICLIGDFEKAPPTAAQLRTLSRLLNDLRQRFGLASEQILTHADLKPTACPGKLFSLDAVTTTGDAVEQRRHSPSPRFTPVRPGIMEEIGYVAKVQRAAGFRRPVAKPDTPQ